MIALGFLRRHLVPLLAILAALVGIVLVLGYFDARRGQTDARDEKTITDARMGSAEGAIASIGTINQHNAEVREEVREAQNELSQIDDPAERDRVARQRLRDLQSGSASSR